MIMTSNFTWDATEPVWFVCHVDTEEEALARAIELGYEPDESELDT